jgi:hypothetical protein
MTALSYRKPAATATFLNVIIKETPCILRNNLKGLALVVDLEYRAAIHSFYRCSEHRGCQGISWLLQVFCMVNFQAGYGDVYVTLLRTAS